MSFLKRRRKGKSDNPAFKTVLLSPHLIEYKGYLPSLGVAVKHHLYCSEVGPAQRVALQLSGIQSITGGLSSHIFFCSFSLNRDAGASRTLFNLGLDLSEFPAGKAAYIAVVVARGLRRTLTDRKSPDFLIRCKQSDEFPFCVDDELIDQFWRDWALAYFRRGIRDLNE